MKPLKRTTALATTVTATFISTPAAYAVGTADAAVSVQTAGVDPVVLIVVAVAAVAGFVGWGVEARKRRRIEREQYTDRMRADLTGSGMDAWDANLVSGVDGIPMSFDDPVSDDDDEWYIEAVERMNGEKTACDADSRRIAGEPAEKGTTVNDLLEWGEGNHPASESLGGRGNGKQVAAVPMGAHCRKDGPVVVKAEGESRGGAHVASAPVPDSVDEDAVAVEFGAIEVDGLVPRISSGEGEASGAAKSEPAGEASASSPSQPAVETPAETPDARFASTVTSDDAPYVPKHVVVRAQPDPEERDAGFEVVVALDGDDPNISFNNTFITALEERYGSILKPQTCNVTEEAEDELEDSIAAPVSSDDVSNGVAGHLNMVVPVINRKPTSTEKSMEMTSADKVAHALANRRALEEAAAEVARVGELSARASAANARALKDAGMHAVIWEPATEPDTVVPVRRGPGFVDVNDNTFARAGAMAGEASAPAAESQLGAVVFSGSRAEIVGDARTRTPGVVEGREHVSAGSSDASPAAETGFASSAPEAGISVEADGSQQHSHQEQMQRGTISCTDSISDFRCGTLHKTYFTQGDMVKVEYPPQHVHIRVEQSDGAATVTTRQHGEEDEAEVRQRASASMCLQNAAVLTSLPLV